MIQINLIPDVKLKLIKAQRQRNLVIAICIMALLISIGIVVLTTLYVFLGQPVRERVAKNEFEKQYKTLREIKDLDKAVTLQNQMSSITKTHSEKMLTSRLLSLLSAISAKNTKNSISIVTFSFNKSDETVSLVANTDGNDFAAADIFKKNLESLMVAYKPYDANGEVPQSDESTERVKFASDVVLSNLSLGATGKDDGNKSVSFGLSFKFNPVVFSMENHIVGITGLGIGNVTDSYIRLPSDMFKEVKKPAEGAEGNRERQ